MSLRQATDENFLAVDTGRDRTGSFWDMRRVNPARSLICLGLGALLGLGIAGYGLFTAKGTVTSRVPPETVALVNQKPILRTDFIAQTEALHGQPFGQVSLAERLKVLDDMIREELFVQRGLELDFPGTDPDTRTALVAAVEQQAVAAVTSSQPSEAELRRHFEENRAAYASDGVMALHHFRLAAGPDATARMKEAATALRRGASTAELGRGFGLEEVVPEHASPEQFYFAQRAHLGDALYAEALNLDNGGVSEPLATPDGVHLLQMVKHVRPVALPFGRVRAQVLSDYIMAAKKRLADADERYLRDKADLLLAEDYAAPYRAAPGRAP